MICNIALDIETAGWGLLICGLIAGVGGLAGSKFAGDVYDEATMTELEKALQKLEQQPENVRLLLYAIIT